MNDDPTPERLMAEALLARKKSKMAAYRETKHLHDTALDAGRVRDAETFFLTGLWMVFNDWHGTEDHNGCRDCAEAARLAYSDATTPGFMFDKCGKHRGGGR